MKPKHTTAQSGAIVKSTPHELAPAASSTHLDEAVNRKNPVWCYLASLDSPSSRKTQAESLAVLSRELFSLEPDRVKWYALEYAELLAIRAWLEKRYAPATANRVICAIRRVLFYAFKLGLMEHADYVSRSDLAPVHGSRLPPGRAITSVEMSELFKTLDPTNLVDIRNAALLSLLYGGGLRRAEAALAQRENYYADTGELHVIGKGNKERVVFLPPGAMAAVNAWLEYRGDEDGALLWPIDHGVHAKHQAMSLAAIRYAMNSCIQDADIPHASPHDMRRTYVGDMLEAGVELRTVQRSVGHASPTTTARYDRRGNEGLQRAASKLNVPFRGVPPTPDPENVS